MTTDTTAATAAPRTTAEPASPRRERLRWLLSPPGTVVLMVLAFILISTVWLMLDKRLPIGDSGRHLSIAFSFADALEEGRFGEPFGAFSQYPPLVHTIGAMALAIFPDSVMTAVLANNIVFVPLLALGIYGTGKVATGDRRVGALAVAFTLASPMVIGLFHEFMVDGPQAALVAVSVWLLLLSDRFARIEISIAAAVAVALGFHSKSTFVLFVAGVVLMLLARGGWRNWRGFALFCLVTLVLVEPWYFRHLSELTSMTEGAAQAQVTNWYADVPYPSRFSPDDLTWYFWAGLNSQLFLPLMLFAIAGVVIAIVRWVRGRKAEGYVPELLAGLVVSWLGITAISLNDPRYTIPGIVFVAVLGTAWIVRLPRKPMLAAMAAIAALLVVNTTMVNVGLGGTARVDLPGHKGSPIGEGRITIFSEGGYVAGGSAPDRSGGALRPLLGILKRARADGAEQIFFQPESLNSGGFTLAALTVYAALADLHVVGFTSNDAGRLGPNDLYVFRTMPQDIKTGKPCLISWDDTGIFLHKGPPDPKRPRFYCPPD